MLQVRSRADASLHSSFSLENFHMVKVGVRQSWVGVLVDLEDITLYFLSGIKNAYKRREC